MRAGVEQTGATVLLKGASQLVASPKRDWVRVALPGSGWTGQAGSGDILGGMCAALLAAGRRSADAALLAASLQAYAAAQHPGRSRRTGWPSGGGGAGPLQRPGRGDRGRTMDARPLGMA